MTIGIGLWAFICFLAIVFLWILLLKRNVTEGLGAAFLVISLFMGPTNYFGTVLSALNTAAMDTPFLATMLFMLMAAIMNKAGVIERLVELLNSLIGKVRGGAAYVSTCASFMFGLVSGNGDANSATVGAITVPWMKESGWPPAIAATINAGNAGVCQAMPACTAMFLLVGLEGVAEYIDVGTAYVAVLCGGIWSLGYRLLRVWLYARKYDVQPVPADRIKPLGKSFRDNGSALLMLVGISIPLVITIGPLSTVLKSIESFGSTGVSAINIVVWVPILVCIICMLIGWKRLPHTVSGWLEIAKGCQKSICSAGTILLFSLASCDVLSKLGFSEDLAVIFENLHLPGILMILIGCLLVVLVASPLSANATTTAIGAVTFTAFIQAGANPSAAVAAYMIALSTAGASPPSSAPIFISCGLAGVEKAASLFKPLVVDYVIPITILAVLVAAGILPVL